MESSGLFLDGGSVRDGDTVYFMQEQFVLPDNVKEEKDTKDEIFRHIAGLNAGNAGGTVQILQQASGGGGGGGGNQQQTVASIPFLSNLGGLPGTTPHKPTGSKICRWMQNDGTVCGKAFSKLDSLRRHVNELHKSIRPYACSQCEKSYGRRDYLDRHTRTHNKKKNAAASSSSLDTWGPNSGVLMQGDEVPPPPKVRHSCRICTRD